MEKIEAIQDASQVEGETKSRASSGCGKKVEEAFHKSVDLIPAQLALAVHSINKADWHLVRRRVDHIFRQKVRKSHLANCEAKLSRPDHHLHLEDVPLGHSCSYQSLQNLEKTQDSSDT